MALMAHSLSVRFVETTLDSDVDVPCKQVCHGMSFIDYIYYMLSM